MSLIAPYSLVAESDTAIERIEGSSLSTAQVQICDSQPTVATRADAVNEQQCDSEGQSLEIENRPQANGTKNGKTSYIPPETVFSKTEIVSINTAESSLGPPRSRDASATLPPSLFSAAPPPSEDHRPQSLNLPNSSHGVDNGRPKKGILKRTSTSTESTDSLRINSLGAKLVRISTSSLSHGAASNPQPVPGRLRSATAQPNSKSRSITEVEVFSDSSVEDYSAAAVETFSAASNAPASTNPQVLLELEESELQDGDDDDDDESEARTLTESSRNRVRRRPPPKRLQRLQSKLNLDELAQNELELKANLFYHIGNPIKRWRVEKVVPGKLVLQLLKTVCLVVQVVLYTNTFPRHRAMFFYQSREVFENLFFRNYIQENPRDIYSAFNAEDILSQFNYTVDRYCELPDITIGGYDFSFDEDNNISPVTMTLQQYAEAVFNTSTDTFILNGTIITKPFNVTCGQSASERYIEESNDRLFNRFVELVISFPIKNMRVIHPEKVECYRFKISINFRVQENSGEVVYFLKERHTRFNCQGDVLTARKTFYAIYGALTVLDLIVFIMCVVSVYLTFKSVKRGFKLYRAMGTFYDEQLNIRLSWWERRALFPVWHVINTISDLLIISGSLIKILLDFFVIDQSAPVRVLLGTAVLFQAMVMLRYISYFKQLNALTRTMYLAIPELLKFLLCSGILFVAFALTGWIVLGPFHVKFLTMNSAIESLFGLLNGDDIYTTFTQIRPQDDEAAYVYSRIFLYIFLALFIYTVLNLFTSLIITAYEASQDWDTATRNEVRRFVFSGPLTPNGVALRDFSLTKKYVDPKLITERERSSLKKRISYRLRSRSYTLLNQ